VLLAAGLLLIFVLGFLQLYPVQNFFFPSNYQKIKLKLVRKECRKINKGLASLQTQVDNLTRLRDQADQPAPIPLNRDLAKPASPRPAAGARSPLELSWQSGMLAAKKKRVYVSRKLNYIEMILKSMDQAVKTSCSTDGFGSSTCTVESGKIGRQILEIQTRWRTYNDRLVDLSKKLAELEEYARSPQAKTSSNTKKDESRL